MDVDLDRERVARQVTGLAEDRVGLAGAGQGVPGEELLVGEGAPEVAGALESGLAVGFRGGGGVARGGFPAADDSITALVSDGLSDGPRLRYITNLHTCPGKQFLRRKSIPVFHPPGRLPPGARPRNRSCPTSGETAPPEQPHYPEFIIHPSSFILPCACHSRPVEQRY